MSPSFFLCLFFALLSFMVNERKKRKKEFSVELQMTWTNEPVSSCEMLINYGD